MIEETCEQIDALNSRHQAEREMKYARRNRIRYIDELLNEFESLNLAEEPRVPTELEVRVRRLICEEAHPISRRPADEVRIVEWMDALYDVQDGLMLTVEDDID